jgi:hypothetical protein
MTGNTFTKIDAGKSTAPFTLQAGKYVVQAAPIPTGPGHYAGLCRLEMKAPSGAFAAVGPSTDFAMHNSVILHLNQGVYRLP